MTLVTHARPWIGTPYQYGGNGTAPGEAVDCSRLVQQVVREVFGLDIPRTADGQWRSRPLDGRIEPADLAHGDLVFFAWPGRGKKTHVGVFVDRHEDGIHIISAEGPGAPAQVTERERVTNTWFGEVVGGWRVADPSSLESQAASLSAEGGIGTGEPADPAEIEGWPRERVEEFARERGMTFEAALNMIRRREPDGLGS